jgi:hypothetical protein
VKIAIPLAAILIFGIAAGVHPAFVAPGEPERRPLRTAEAAFPTPETAASPAVGAPGAKASVPPAGEGAPGGKAPEAVASARKPAEPAWRKTSLQLARELALTPLQQGSVEQILQERREEIRKCHEEIRKARVLDVRQYEWQVGRMKESWYRQIDRLLDAEQHRRFVTLVENGLFNEGLGFTEDPGMTVLD